MPPTSKASTRAPAGSPSARTASKSASRQLADLGAGQAHKISRSELDLEPAPSCADVDRLVLERRRVDKGRKRAALAEWRDATQHVAGRTLSLRAIRHRRA